MAGAAGGDRRIDARVALATALGVAILVAVLVVGASIQRTRRDGPVRRLGAIDAVVRTPTPLPTFAALRRARPAHAAVLTPFEIAPATVEARNGRIDASANVIAFDGAPVRAGALVNSDLAAILHVQRGDVLSVDTGARTSALAVVGVVPAQGLAGFALDASARGANVVVSPSTYASLHVRGDAAIAVTGSLDDVHVRGATVDRVKDELRADARRDADALSSPVNAAGVLAIAGWIVLFVVLCRARRAGSRDIAIGTVIGTVVGVAAAALVAHLLRVGVALSMLALGAGVAAGALVSFVVAGVVRPRGARASGARRISLRAAAVCGAAIVVAITLPAVVHLTSPLVLVVRASVVGALAAALFRRSLPAVAAVIMCAFAVSGAFLDSAPVANARLSTLGAYTVVGHDAGAQRLPTDELASFSDDRSIAPLATTTARVGRADAGTFVRVPLTVFDASLIARRPPPLLHRGAFATDEDAYTAVLQRPGLVIASDALFERVGRSRHRVVPGDTVRIGDGRATVVATTRIDLAQLGVFTSAQTARTLTGAVPAVNGFLLATDADRADVVASDIDASLWERGIDAKPVSVVVRATAQRLASLAHVVEILELLGLIAAVAAVFGSSELPVRRAVMAIGIGLVLAAVAEVVDHAAARPDLAWRLPNLPGAGMLVGAAIVLVIGASVGAERQSMRLARAMRPSHDAEGFGVRANVARSTATSPNFGS